MTIVLAACTGGRESSPPPRAVERAALEFQAPASRAGRLVLTEGQLRFVSCGESGEGAEDRGYAMWDGVFFELRPAGAETSLKD